MKFNECIREGGPKLLNLLNYCVFTTNTDALFLYLVHEYRLRPTASGALAIFELFCDQQAPAAISTSASLQTADWNLTQSMGKIREAVQRFQQETEAASASTAESTGADLAAHPVVDETGSESTSDGESTGNDERGEVGDEGEPGLSKETVAGDSPAVSDRELSDRELSDSEGWMVNPFWATERATVPQNQSAVAAPPASLFDAAERQLRGSSSVGLVMIERVYQPELRPLENLPGKKMSSGQRRFVEGVWCPVVRPRLVAAGFWRLSSIG